MTAHTPGPLSACTCCIREKYMDEPDYERWIDQCPLHAAAPRMLDTLKVIRDSHLDENTHYEQLVALMRAVANTIIKEIEG